MKLIHMRYFKRLIGCDAEKVEVHVTLRMSQAEYDVLNKDVCATFLKPLTP